MSSFPSDFGNFIYSSGELSSSFLVSTPGIILQKNDASPGLDSRAVFFFFRPLLAGAAAFFFVAGA